MSRLKLNSFLDSFRIENFCQTTVLYNGVHISSSRGPRCHRQVGIGCDLEHDITGISPFLDLKSSPTLLTRFLVSYRYRNLYSKIFRRSSTHTAASWRTIRLTATGCCHRDTRTDSVRMVSSPWPIQLSKDLLPNFDYVAFRSENALSYELE